LLVVAAVLAVSGCGSSDPRPTAAGGGDDASAGPVASGEPIASAAPAGPGPGTTDLGDNTGPVAQPRVLWQGHAGAEYAGYSGQAVLFSESTPNPAGGVTVNDIVAVDLATGTPSWTFAASGLPAGEIFYSPSEAVADGYLFVLTRPNKQFSDPDAVRAIKVGTSTVAWSVPLDARNQRPLLSVLGSDLVVGRGDGGGGTRYTAATGKPAGPFQGAVPRLPGPDNHDGLYVDTTGVHHDATTTAAVNDQSGMCAWSATALVEDLSGALTLYDRTSRTESWSTPEHSYACQVATNNGVVITQQEADGPIVGLSATDGTVLWTAPELDSNGQSTKCTVPFVGSAVVIEECDDTFYALG
jgi:hypothetical protein